MTNATFTADLEKFANLTENKLRRVMQQSLQDIMSTAQTTVDQGGNMPVDTGFLRNSIVGGLDGSDVAKGDGKTDGSGDGVVTLTIAQMQLGQEVRFAWIAAYARARHYKGPDFGRGGGMWRDLAVQQWQSVVEKNAGLVR